MTKPTRLQRYTVRLGHDVNGIRPVMIPDGKGEWLNQNDVAHQLHVLELHVKELTADLASEAACREAETVEDIPLSWGFHLTEVLTGVSPAASAHAVIEALRSPEGSVLTRGVATAAGVAPALVDYGIREHADLRDNLMAAIGDMTEHAMAIKGYIPTQRNENHTSQTQHDDRIKDQAEKYEACLAILRRLFHSCDTGDRRDGKMCGVATPSKDAVERAREFLERQRGATP